MDEHARRVTEPLRTAWGSFASGEATLLDLSRITEQAADALDNSNASLRAALANAARELEYAYHATEAEEHSRAAQRFLGPALPMLGLAILELTRDELLWINNALNEVVNGPDRIEDWEFHTRIGGERSEVSPLLRRVSDRVRDLQRQDPEW